MDEAVELAQQLGVVLPVGGVVASVATRVDPGSPIERVDLQTGIVGQRRQTGALGVVARLDGGIALERLRILDRLTLDADLVRRHQRHVGEVQQLI